MGRLDAHSSALIVIKIPLRFIFALFQNATPTIFHSVLRPRWIRPVAVTKLISLRIVFKEFGRVKNGVLDLEDI
jgi:hypothetical protein